MYANSRKCYFQFFVLALSKNVWNFQKMFKIWKIVHVAKYIRYFMLWIPKLCSYLKNVWNFKFMSFWFLFRILKIIHIFWKMFGFPQKFSSLIFALQDRFSKLLPYIQNMFRLAKNWEQLQKNHIFIKHSCF